MSSNKSNKSDAVATIAEAVAHYRTDNLRGYVSREDLQSDAWILLATGAATDAADAVRLAYNAAREERVNGLQVRTTYLSTLVSDADGGTVSLAEKLADTVAAPAETEGRGTDYTRGDLLAAVESVRHAKTERAHGWAPAQRGRKNGAVGVINDAAVLAAIEAVGGTHYGYAAKVVAYFAAEGRAIKANAVYQAVKRAKDRTEGGRHSANGI
jgi:hypothetical protein